MKSMEIKVETEIDASLQKVWKCWSMPEDVIKWNHASPDWHTTRATNDLRIGGKFNYRMEAKDGTFGFDFEGEYELVIENKQINYLLADGRRVKIVFTPTANGIAVVETFDAENVNPVELQRNGWQAILNNFKIFVETT
jgi:uncharacterized protein YndB with AHSA1/START domain